MEFITKKSDSSFPLTIVVNVRSQNVLKYNEYEKTLSIPNDEKMYIIDGQHRYEALKYAFEEDFPVGNFEIPISLFNHNHWLNEALEFLTINRSAQAVKTDLAERIIVQARKDREFKVKIDEESVGPLKKIVKGSENILKLVEIIDRFSDDRNSFWFARIKRPNEESSKGKTISERAFTQSLTEFTKSPAFSELDLDIIIRALDNFWKTIAQLCPVSADPSNKSILLKTTGVTVFNRVFSYLVGQIRIKKSKYVLTEEIFQEYLKKAGEYVEDTAWEKDGKMSLYGTGAKSFSLMTKIVMEEIEYNLSSETEDEEKDYGDIEI